MSARLLVRALRDPASLDGGCDWNGMIAAARAEQLLGSLAFRLEGRELPARVAEILEDARADAEHGRTRALWEAEMARRALAARSIPTILLKGTALHAARLEASRGRSVGDLDILVARDRIGEAEAALLAAGWERLKQADGYDDLYYRRWMHELPPLIHKERDRMADVHHTILPLTHRIRPDAEALIAASVEAPGGYRMLCPEDMVCHAAAHLFADGDLAGGLRNLWDIDRLFRQFDGPGFRDRLAERATLHGLSGPVGRALRLAARLYGTPTGLSARLSDLPFEARLLARDGWGRERRKALRFAFYLRSHWLRMPPLMLARHLWAKKRIRAAAARPAPAAPR